MNNIDELLFSRVKQLREIEERLEAIEPHTKNGGDSYIAWKMINELRRDIFSMVVKAQQEHDDF